jgi:lipoprotein-anchoring transpeptidase ErfK/SrfK
MEPDHFSTEWDNAPMPHSIFFTYQGHAIHGSPYTRRLGRAASHGCVRLAPRDAVVLYSLVGQMGMAQTKIVIADGAMANAASPGKPQLVPKSNRPLRSWPWERRRRN